MAVQFNVAPGRKFNDDGQLMLAIFVSDMLSGAVSVVLPVFVTAKVYVMT